MMNTRAVIPLFAAIIFALSPAAALAAGGIMVDFDSVPLFKFENLRPGDSVTKTVKVTNKYDTDETVYVEALNVTNTGLAAGMTLTVTEGTTQRYYGTFADFFSAGHQYLGPIVGGGTNTYVFTAALPEDSGNAFQGGKIGFDLCVGLAGGTLLCDGTHAGGNDDDGGDTPASGPTGGGGGGTLGSSLKIIFKSDAATPASPATNPWSATIQWDTNLPATSWVIYGAVGEPHALNLNATNYGYPHATTEDTRGTSHGATLFGLDPSKAYVYRIVSREYADAPPTITEERTLSLAMPQSFRAFGMQPEGRGGGGIIGQVLGAAAEVLGGDAVAAGGEAGEAAAGTEAGSGTGGQTAAAALALPGFFERPSCFFVFVVILISLYILWRVFARSRGYNHLPPLARELREVIFFMLGIAVALAIAKLIGWLCIIVPLSITFGVLLIVLAWNRWQAYRE